jgi:hypothetical protein
VFWWIPVFLVSFACGAFLPRTLPGVELVPWAAAAAVWEVRRPGFWRFLPVALVAWAGRPLGFVLATWPGWGQAVEVDWPGLVLALGVALAALPVPGFHINRGVWAGGLRHRLGTAIDELFPLALLGGLFLKHPVLAALLMMATVWVCGRTAVYGERHPAAGGVALFLGAGGLAGGSYWHAFGVPAVVLHACLPGVALALWAWRVSAQAGREATAALLERELAAAGLEFPCPVGRRSP